ncbi:energy transducer TonB [Marinilabiliaceae bacterium JC017]|nr:energy transducer TonB [Marinilabiliaceae bacterium JC017]
MKKVLFTLLIVINTLTLKAQSSDTIFFNSNWEKCEKLDARYYRIIKQDSLFNAKDYFLSGQLQMDGMYLTRELKTKHGQFSYYNEEGKLLSKAYYRNGEKYKHTEYFDKNGQLIKDMRAFDELDTEPEFKGGEDGFAEYLTKNLIYPKRAQKAGVSGRVYVNFWVMQDGSTDHITIKRKAHPDLDNAAMKIIQQSPKWKPGTINGKPVIVEYTVPINFSLY